MHPASSSSASWRGRGRGKASVSSEALPEDTAADPVVESSEALPDDGQYGIHYTARDKGSGKGYMKGRWRPVFEEGLLLRLKWPTNMLSSLPQDPTHPQSWQSFQELADSMNCNLKFRMRDRGPKTAQRHVCTLLVTGAPDEARTLLALFREAARRHLGKYPPLPRADKAYEYKVGLKTKAQVVERDATGSTDESSASDRDEALPSLEWRMAELMERWLAVQQERLAAAPTEPPTVPEPAYTASPQHDTPAPRTRPEALPGPQTVRVEQPTGPLDVWVEFYMGVPEDVATLFCTAINRLQETRLTCACSQV